MSSILISTFLAFLLTYVTIPIVIRISKAKKLYDEPDSFRKLHKVPVPSMGGVGIFIGYVSALLYFVEFSTFPEFQSYLFCFLIIFFVGVQDDLSGISPVRKLFAQILVSAILIFKAHLAIDFSGFTGFANIDSFISYGFTFIAIIAIINSFNLIDGVDGLAGSLGLISSFIFGILFFVNGNFPYAILGFGFAASVLGFLVYNFPPARIFMGDTGSLLIGVVNSILLFKFMQNISELSHFSISNAPAVAFSLILLPILDTLRVFAIRISKGGSPFKADRNHLHHLLLDKGFTAKKVTLTCALSSVVVVISTFVIKELGTAYTICILTTVFFTTIFMLSQVNKIGKSSHLSTGDLLEENTHEGEGIIKIRNRFIRREILEKEKT